MKHDQDILNSNNKTKSMWDIVKNATKPTRNLVENVVLKDNDRDVNDPATVASLFNQYFSRIAVDLTKGFQPQNSTSDVSLKVLDTMFVSETSSYEILKIIGKLKNKYSAGLDEFPDCLLKTCAPAIIHPLTHIFNASLCTGIFPDIFKTAKIKPLFKKGNKNEVQNYRPISLLSVFSKILERLFYVRMETFLNKHDAFSNCQHGFRKSKSTETAIFSFLKDVASSLDQNEATIGIFLDLSKAFDVIDHNILLSKLPSYGIRGIALDWLCSYLKQRSQRVEIPYWNDGTLCTHLSGSLPIVRGVPQGSILGPILFLLYVNDMPLAIRNGRTVLFADDTNILCNKETVNSTISDVSNWFRNNKLKVNENKTVSMQFSISNKKFCTPLKMNGVPLTDVNVTKFLGLSIQSNLKWNAHLNELNTKLSSLCYAFRILSNSVSLHTARCVYFANVHSRLRYGIIFWGNTSYSSQTFRLQKRIVRIISKSNPRDSCKSLFINLGILPLPCLLIYESVVFVKNDLLKDGNIFSANADVYKYNTRRSNHIHQVAVSTAHYKKFTYNSCTLLYNTLPEDIKRLNSIEKFKSQVKSFLLHNCFYTIRDYTEHQKGK